MKHSAREAGRDPATIEITAGADQDCDTNTVKRYEGLGVARVMVSLPTRDPADLQRSLAALHQNLISKVSLRQTRLAAGTGTALVAWMGHQEGAIR